MFCLLLAGLKEDVILLIVLFDQRVKLYCFTMTIFCKLFSVYYFTFSNLSDIDMLLFLFARVIF